MRAVLFSSYFPNIQYLSTVCKFENIVIDLYEHFPKQTYRNRCNILTANGNHAIAVPVNKKNKTITKDVMIDYSENWQKNHSRTLLSAYKNSPFFEYYCEDLLVFTNCREKYLWELNRIILDKILKILQLEINLEYSDSYIEQTDAYDFRQSISPKNRTIIDKGIFVPKQYNQVFSDRFSFIPNLSVLDLIFNEGPLAKSIIRNSIT